MLGNLLRTILDHLLPGLKTYLAGAGLIGLAVYQLSQGDTTAALQSFLAGMAALGLRSAMDRPPPPVEGLWVGTIRMPPDAPQAIPGPPHSIP